LVKKNISINLKLISEKDHKFLYELLKEREPSINISHKKMPTFNEHIKFIKSKPYTKWYIVKYGAQKIASIYLTSQNEIGIFIKKTHQNKNLGRIMMSQLIKKNPRERYLANVSPKNKTSENFFKSYGFKFIQKTYELTQN